MLKINNLADYEAILQIHAPNPSATLSVSIKTIWECIPKRGYVLFILSALTSSILLEHVNMKTFINYNGRANCSFDEVHLGPSFAVYGRSRSEHHLKHVLEILEKLGLHRVPVESANWDLLWAHDFPFLVMSERLKNLNQHQKLNHFPGCGFITNKVDLSITNLPFQPKAFKLPRDKEKFIAYKNTKPETLFVEKHNEHRHIFIKAVKDINLNSNESFIQEFVDHPYLVDGYKFDIGVYVVITSINPLRVYIYTGDVLFRYCMEKYYPFNVSKVEKYVVGDDYLPTWDVPSLGIFFNKFKFSMKDSFDAYVKLQNQNPKFIWDQVENIIRETILAKEKNIIDILKNYKTRNFFELMRFDLVIDENLKVWLMEANMSPNLSSAHFKQNSLLYEQLLYSVLQLVGVASPLKRSSFKKSDAKTEMIISSYKNIAVDSEICYQESCQGGCQKRACELCLNCLSKNEVEFLFEAYREHIHRGDTKRIFPKPVNDLKNYDIEKETKLLSQKNAMITRWFHGKCKIESSWCT